MNVAEFIVQQLKRIHIKYVFGVPGVNVLPLFQAIEVSPDLQMITCRSEIGAAYMADGYARVNGAGCFIATTGPGIANSINGIISSYYDSVPVIVLSAQINTNEYGKYGIQEMTGHGRSPNMLEMMKNITKKACRVEQAQAIGKAVENSFSSAFSGRKGPVYLEICEDVLVAPYDGQTMVKAGGNRDESHWNICTDSVKLAVQTMSHAKKLLILVGGGSRNTNKEEFLSLADKLDGDIVTTLMAKGMFSCHDARYKGVIGCYGNTLANQRVMEADVILASGVSFSYLSTSGWSMGIESKQLIRIDIDEAELYRNYKPDIGFLASCESVIQELNSEVSLYESGNKMAASAVKEYSFAVDRLDASIMDISGDGIHPIEAVQTINRYITEAVITVMDVGQHSYWMERYAVSFGKQMTMINGGNGSMGHGVAAAIGVSCGLGKNYDGNRVICICGDGGFLMNGNELGTAAKYAVNVIWIVFNNGILGTQKAWCDKVGYLVDCQTPPIDMVGFAISQGVMGIRVNTVGQLADALDEAFNDDQPYVIDVKILPHVYPAAFYGERVSHINR